MYAFSLIWGVCAAVDQRHYDVLDVHFKEMFQQLRFPRCETIFDFMVDPQTQKNFIPWEGRMEEFVFSKETPYFNLLVPTIDTTKISYILDKMIEIQKPCLFTG